VLKIVNIKSYQNSRIGKQSFQTDDRITWKHRVLNAAVDNRNASY